MAVPPPASLLRISQTLPYTACGMAAIAPRISARERVFLGVSLFMFNRILLNGGGVKGVPETFVMG